MACGALLVGAAVVPAGASAAVGDVTAQEATSSAGVYASGDTGVVSDSAGYYHREFVATFVDPRGSVSGSGQLNAPGPDLTKTWATLNEQTDVPGIRSCQVFANPAHFSDTTPGVDPGAIAEVSFDVTCNDGSPYAYYRADWRQFWPYYGGTRSGSGSRPGIWSSHAATWTSGQPATYGQSAGYGNGALHYLGPGSETAGFRVCGIYADGTSGACFGDALSYIAPVMSDVVVTEAGSPSTADTANGHPPSTGDVLRTIVNTAAQTAQSASSSIP
jgi:hypothetical protein